MSFETHPIEFSCMFYGFPCIGISENTDLKTIDHILSNAKIEVIMCHVNVVAEIINSKNPLKAIIYWGGDLSKDVPIGSTLVFSLDEVVSLGDEFPLDPKPNQKDDIFTIIYTSGSTGFPKGVVYTDNAWNRDMKAYPSKLLVGCSYQPISHIVDPHHVSVTLFNGGRIGFIPNIVNFFDHISKLKPTILMGAPRIYNKIYEEHISEPEKNLSNLLGGRCTTLVVGGAPLAKHVAEFLEKTFKASVVVGYGTTESGNISFNGGKITGDFKLLDCPDLGYTRQDLPYPRGELCVKNENMFSGYYNDPQKTSEAFTEDGYFKTGDLVEILPNNECNVIARRKETYKLSNGEFYQPVSLEHHFQEAFESISQIYIHGDSSRPYLV